MGNEVTPIVGNIISPEQIVETAHRAAKILMDIVENDPRKLVLAGQTYLKIDHWQMVGKFNQLNVRIEWTRPVDGGWEARAVVIDPAGIEVAAGEAQCLKSEPKWFTRAKYEWIDGKRVKTGEEDVPDFQRRSMAQTRAAAKALRLSVGWVVALAGYATTPAEEMDGVNPEPEHGAVPEPKPHDPIERRMKSKFDSKCNFCGKKHIAIGDEIVLIDGKWGAEACHKTPEPDAAPPEQDEAETPPENIPENIPEDDAPSSKGKLAQACAIMEGDLGMRGAEREARRLSVMVDKKGKPTLDFSLATFDSLAAYMGRLQEAEKTGILWDMQP